MDSATDIKLKELQHKLTKKASDLERQLEQTKQELSAVKTTLDLLKVKGIAVDEQETADLFEPERGIMQPSDLTGLTHMQAILTIAQANGNRVRLTTAKELFLKSGITTSKKNALHIVFNVIKRSGRFKKIAAGTYELLPPEPAGLPDIEF
jgi:hypothetical protein